VQITPRAPAYLHWRAVLAHASCILQLRAEQSNRPGASQQGVAVVSEGALERTRESSLPEALSDPPPGMRACSAARASPRVLGIASAACFGAHSVRTTAVGTIIASSRIAVAIVRRRTRLLATGNTRGLWFKQAGYEIHAGVDNCTDCCAAYRLNHGCAYALDLLTAEGQVRALELCREADVVVGSPPCQGFSQCNKHRLTQRWRQQSRAH
jgi:hypothetical protein